MELKYKLSINNKQQDSSITNRILAFELLEHTGLQLDTLTFVLNNSDSKLELPRTNAIIEPEVGFKETVRMGEYVAQFVESNNSTVTIKAVSQDLQKGRIKQNRLFEQKSLKDVLETLAGSLGLTLKLDPSLQIKQIPYLMQQEQTDLSLLQELGEIFYAIASVKNGSLVFGGKDSTNLLGNITIKNSNILDIKQLDSEYKTYSGVKTSLWDTKNATKEEIKLGTEPYLAVPSIYGLDLTKELVRSKYKQLAETEIIELKTIGNPMLQAGATINIGHEDFIK